MDKKKILFIIGIVLIVILGIIAINIGKKSSNTEPPKTDNLNESILKDTTVENLSITNQSVVTRDGLSTYMANLENKASETKHIDYLYITFTINNEENNVLALKDTNLEPNGKLPIIINFDADISKASKVTYEITNEKK